MACENKCLLTVNSDWKKVIWHLWLYHCVLRVPEACQMLFCFCKEYQRLCVSKLEPRSQVCGVIGRLEKEVQHKHAEREPFNESVPLLLLYTGTRTGVQVTWPCRSITVQVNILDLSHMLLLFIYFFSQLWRPNSTRGCETPLTSI